MRLNGHAVIYVLKGYVAEDTNLASETSDLPLSEVVHAGVIAIVHEVVDG